MVRWYTRLSFAEREEISRHLAAGASGRAIARRLGRSPSTISRELHRTSKRRLRTRRRRYRAGPAHRGAAQTGAARHLGRRKLLIHARLQAAVHARLAQRWSPEQIARWLITEYPDDATMRISHEAIYTYLYVLPRGELKQTLLRCLRQRRKHRKRRGAAHDRRGQIPDMLSIEERPAEVADRTVPGHWEGDLLMGRRHASALGTLVERTTRFTLLVPLRGQDPTTVRHAFAREMRTLPAQVRRSLTYDRGREMLEHRLFTRDTQVQVYFAHPHSPWERGTNENTNGLIRQFFPKGTDFSQVSRREIKHVQALLNGRPRKVLNWRFPCEALRDHLVALET
jgi:IS30 family transposase